MIGLGEMILVDTSVLLPLFREDPLGRRIEADYGVLARAPRPTISIITVGEILALARRNKYGVEKHKKLDAMIGQLVVVDIGRTIAERFALVQLEQQAIGKPIGENDTWIVATAMSIDATLLTMDRDFERVALGLIKVEIIGHS